MSPLTKIFVMLLVVVSLLNAAATVVYVNKEQATDDANKALQAKVNEVGRNLELAKSDADTAKGQLTAQMQLAASESAAKQAALDKSNADLASKDADNKQLLRNNQAQLADAQQVSAQLAIALQTAKDETQTINDLRDRDSKLVQAQAESDAAVAQQRELAETYGRQVEYLTEQIKKGQDLIKAYSDVLTQNHLVLPTAAPTASTFSGPPVAGVVQDKQAINGVTYLTISVGKADNVQSGMEFKVVDTQAQPHQFLGILTITQTDANTSVGRLQADQQLVDRVQKGDEVSSDVQ